MSQTTTEISDIVYIAKLNALVTDGREDLIAAIIADYERGGSDEPGEERAAS